MVSVCLPSDALLQHLPSYLGFSYLGRGVSLHGCSSKAQLLLLTLDEGYLLTTILPDLQRGIAPLGPPAILQARLQQYVNRELPGVQAGFRKDRGTRDRKGRGTRDQVANICWIMEKAREVQKTSITSLLTIPKTLTVWTTINCGKFWERWEYQTTWPVSWEICMQVRKQQLELDMEQQTGSK